jgi:hypothetical protein
MYHVSSKAKLLFSSPDMIATMGETTGYFAIKHMRSQMMSDPIGRQILE